MARRVFPDDGDVRRIDGAGRFLSAVGSTATVYADADGTILADIHTYPGDIAVPGSTLTVDIASCLPAFLGPDDAVDTLWVSIADGPVTAIHVRTDDRLDALEETAASLGTAATLDAGTADDELVLGGDSRMDDARQPTAHASTHAPGQGDALSGLTAASMAAGSVDGAAATASLRTLGTGAQQAAAGDHGHSISGVTGLQTTLDGKLSSTLKGAASGLAELNESGTVPTAQLPSYVDDVLEYANVSAFPAIGATGKIYVALDTNLAYRWSGSAYVEISPSLALGETSATAYRGDRGKTAYDHSQTTGNPHSTTKANLGLGNVDNTSDLNKPISSATQTVLDGKQPLAATLTDITARLGSKPEWVTAPASEFDVTWTQRALPASTGWRSVTYGNGIYVAVALNSAIAATSPDGITWTQRALPISSGCYSVTYGNGLFVAVATDSSVVVTSPDGITWLSRVLPVSAGWRSVTYGNGLFVAVAYASSIAATSPDGITWTQRALPASTTWQSVTYGNGLYVAVAYLSAIAATSPDGITWTQRVLPVSTGWRSVTYGDNLYVAVALNSAIAATSPDGITWTQRVLPVSTGWCSVRYGSGLYVTVANDSSIAATSPDGITWTQRALPTSTGWIALTYGNGLFVAVATTSAIAATSNRAGDIAVGGGYLFVSISPAAGWYRVAKDAW